MKGIQKTGCEKHVPFLYFLIGGLYKGHYGGYTEEDFGRLLEVLSEVKGRFMLSSYPSELLTERTATHGWHTVEVEQQRSAGGGRKIEVLTMNYDPSTLTPAPDPILPSEDSPTEDSSAPTA